VARTWERLAKRYYFPGIYRVVKEIVGEYNIYIQNKVLYYALYRIIQIPDIPKTPWTSIVLDFVVKLLLSQDPIIGVEYNSILVVTDRLTKYIYIILYLKASTAEDLVYIFLRIVVANYSALEKMISDKNKFFIL
jgi:hypothetical protein